MPDRFNILSRAAAGDPVAEKMAYPIMLQGLRAFFRNNFDLSLQRCIGLPETMSSLLRPQRNYWLLVAFWHCHGNTRWKKCETLAKEIRRMQTVQWPQWCFMQAPPDDAAELNKALFHAMKIGHAMNPEKPSIPETARQLDNIMKNSLAEISQDQQED